jgi:hypothetical protein
MEDSDADVRYYASRAKEKTTQGGAEPMNRKFSESGDSLGFTNFCDLQFISSLIKDNKGL